MNKTVRHILCSIVLVVVLAFCGACDTKGGQPEPAASVQCAEADFAARAAAFEQRKREMLAVADRTGGFGFSDDAELDALDPNAFWLMNRMMQMHLLVETADDAWAWVLAMNESVEAYNRRLGREIGSADAAVLAMGELIDIYNSGSQPELNTASYVTATLAAYEAGYEYWRLMESIDDCDDESDEDDSLRNLCYSEFCEWFDLHRAATGILYCYTYAAARYSALPMDINGLSECWARARAQELEIEYRMCWSAERASYKSDARRVSARKFDRLTAYFKGRTQQDMIEEIMSGEGDEDDSFAREWTEGRYDFDEIAETVRSYETALRNWLSVREQIALSLKDKAQQRSYRELTEQIYARFYNDLEKLKEIHY